MQALLALPPAGRDPALRRLPGRRPAARRRARRRARPRRPAARVLAARPGRGAGGPARLVRPRGRRRAARRGHGDLPGRAGGAVDRAAGPRRARRHRCSSSRRPTSARWPPPGPPGCGWCRCPPTPTGYAPTSSPAAFARTGARLFYCQPLYANPHGATLAAHRRPEVAEAVRDAGAFLIEDDYARDLTIDGTGPAAAGRRRPRRTRRLPAFADQVRRAGAAGRRDRRPRPGRSPGCARPGCSTTSSSPGPLQQATLEFVTAPAWQRHRRALRTALRARREALLTALRRHLPELDRPAGPARRPAPVGPPAGRAPTTSRWPPPQPPPASSSSPAAPGTPPNPRPRTCA